MGVRIEAGKFYVDADGFVHGPMVVRDADPAAHIEGKARAGGAVWYLNGNGVNPGYSWSPSSLVSEWTPPVPPHAAKESERLRREVDSLKIHLNVHKGLKLADTFRDDCIKAERRVETHATHYLTALHAACSEAGAPVTSEIAHDEKAIYGLLIDRIRDLRPDISPHEECAAEVRAKLPPDGHTPVYIPTDRLQQFSSAASDLACWMRGYVAALPRDEFGGGSSDREPMGQYVITELNLAMKQALDRADAAEKKS